MGGHKSKKTVTVALEDLNRVCHNCGKVSDTVKDRTFYSKNYAGPCGDSFCYAGCDSSSCRPTRKRICKKCEEKLAK